MYRLQICLILSFLALMKQIIIIKNDKSMYDDFFIKKKNSQITLSMEQRDFYYLIFYIIICYLIIAKPLFIYKRLIFISLLFYKLLDKFLFVCFRLNNIRIRSITTNSNFLCIFYYLFILLKANDFPV